MNIIINGNKNLFTKRSCYYIVRSLAYKGVLFLLFVTNRALYYTIDEPGGSVRTSEE